MYVLHMQLCQSALDHQMVRRFRKDFFLISLVMVMRCAVGWDFFHRDNLHPCRWQNKTWWCSFCLSWGPFVFFFHPVVFFICVLQTYTVYTLMFAIFPVYLARKHLRAMFQTLSHVDVHVQLLTSCCNHNQSLTGCSALPCPWSRWWFQTCCIFTPILGEDFPFDEHIFQMGGSTTNQVIIKPVKV